MSDLQKWLEWLKADPSTALTCYTASGLSWSEAWKEYSKRFLPKSKDPLDLQEFDFQYNEKVTEYVVYGFRLCGNYWLVISYFYDDVTLYKSTDDKYWHNNEILLRFDRPDNVWHYQLVEICLKEIEPYMYNLLFPITVQTTEDEA